MGQKINLQEEIRRITNENAAQASAKALEVAEQAKSKAAEVAALAIAKALEAATLAATKAADAASAAAAIAVSTGKDLEYMRKAMDETKADISKINEKLDNKYVTKEEIRTMKEIVDEVEKKFVSKEEFQPLKEEVGNIRANLSRAVWIVLTAVILAVLTVVIITK